MGVGILFHGKGLSGESRFLYFQTVRLGDKQVSGNLSAGIQKHFIAGNKVGGGDFRGVSVFYKKRFGAAHFLQGMERPLGFSLLNDAYERID